jgi:hypothetical protein
LERFLSVPKYIQHYPFVALIKNYVEIIFDSILGIFDKNKNLIELIDGQTVAVDSDILVIKRKGTLIQIIF